jgi:hypothetical protein
MYSVRTLGHELQHCLRVVEEDGQKRLLRRVPRRLVRAEPPHHCLERGVVRPQHQQTGAKLVRRLGIRHHGKVRILEQVLDVAQQRPLGRDKHDALKRQAPQMQAVDVLERQQAAPVKRNAERAHNSNVDGGERRLDFARQLHLLADEQRDGPLHK